MAQLIRKRLIGSVLIVPGVTLITFLTGTHTPGALIHVLMGPQNSPFTYARLKHVYELDLPWYLHYFSVAFHFLQGYASTTQLRLVTNILTQGRSISPVAGMWSIEHQPLMGVSLGIIAVLRAGTWIDTTSMLITLVLYAIPFVILAAHFQSCMVHLPIQHSATEYLAPGTGTAQSELKARRAPSVSNRAGTIVRRAGISYPGLSVQPSGSSIGSMISQSTNSIQAYTWELLVPSLTPVIIVLSFSFIGDGLRDAFDPRSKDPELIPKINATGVASTAYSVFRISSK